MNEAPTGKPCPDCGAPMVALRSLERRICTGCRKEWPWLLKPGQPPLVSTNRDRRKEPPCSPRE